MGNALLYISLSHVDFGRVRPQGAPCFCFVFDLLIHGSDCIRSNTLKNGMPEAAASKLPTSPIFQKDLTFPGSSV